MVAICLARLPTLHSFHFTDGSGPFAALALGTDRSLYGTTVYGGSGTFCPYTYGCGTIFKVSSGGVLTTLHSCPDTQQSVCQQIKRTGWG